MNAPLIWIIDEEWPDHATEIELITAALPDADIRESGYDWRTALAAFGRGADLIIAQVYADLPTELIGGLLGCRGIALMGGGFDRVDIATATACGIPVCNVQGYCAEDIADYVIQAILHALRPLDALDATHHNLPWGLPALAELTPRPSSSTLHIVGLGRIGTQVARKARALGMRVTASDQKINAANAAGIEIVDLDSGLAGADFVSLHCPLMPSTTGLISERQLARMRPGAVLINTARGDLIDEGALADALDSGHLGGAVLDVVRDEPPDGDSPIFASPNVIITPHISYATSDSLRELRQRATDNALAMLAGRMPSDCVNPTTREDYSPRSFQLNPIGVQQ